MNANIPIGNATLKDTISFITTAVSWTAALYIGYIIKSKNNMLRNKLK